jgi:hypothetical protein
VASLGYGRKAVATACSGRIWTISSARSRRIPARLVGDVVPECAAAMAAVEASKRHVFSFQRAFGWILVMVCIPVALLVLLGGIVQGFSADLVKA